MIEVVTAQEKVQQATELLSEAAHLLALAAQPSPQKEVFTWQWSQRTRTALVRLRIRTFADLAARTETELLKIPNFGRRSLAEVRYVLAVHGLRLREPDGAGTMGDGS